MAPPRSLRTYSRGHNNSSINSIDAMNILFAKNLTERKLHSRIRKGKNKIQIKELPRKIKSVLSDEPSLHVNFNNDTFDKLLKSTQNTKTTKDMSVKIIAKNTSTTMIKHFGKGNNFSPMICKLRSFANKTDSSVESSGSSWFKPPKLLRGRIINDSEIEKTETSTKDSLKSKNYEETSSCSWFKQPTLPGERITNELEIEEIGKSNRKVNKSNKSLSRQNCSSRESPILLRSRVKLPNILITDASKHTIGIEQSKIAKESNNSTKKNNESSVLLESSNLSYIPIFTNSLRERMLMHSSTPVVSSKNARFVKHPISPINNGTVETEDADEEINNSILKSLEEIQSWDEKFPSVDAQNKKADDTLARTDFSRSLENEGGSSNKPYLGRNNFVTVRGRKISRVDLNLDTNRDRPNKTKSFNLDEFEQFFNKFKTRSFKLEDFEHFHNSHFTQSQVNKLNGISLKDFESFYQVYQNTISMNDGSFLVRSNRNINYVTNRKHRFSLSKASGDLSQKCLNLNKQFDLKNLVVLLDDVLVRNKSEKLKKSKSLCQTAVMNSIIRKQPVVNLTRLSSKSFSEQCFKAKDRLSLQGYKACRKFSSNHIPRRNTLSVTSCDSFNLRELFINISRMSLNVGEKKKKCEKLSKNSKIPQKFSEKEMNSDSASEKENEKSRRRTSNRRRDSKKSSKNNVDKDYSFSSPDNTSFKSFGRKSNSKRRHNVGTSKSLGSDEMHSGSDQYGIKISLLSKSWKEDAIKRSNGEKKYIAKILVGSVSDSEIELNNTKHSVLKEISKSLRKSHGNIPNSPDASKLINSSNNSKSIRVSHSYSNKSRNSSFNPKKFGTHLHSPSPHELHHEVNLRLPQLDQSHSSDTYTAQDMSSSILVNKHYDLASPVHPRLVINLEQCDHLVNSEGVTRESINSTRRKSRKENNSSDSKLKNKTKHKGSQNLNINSSPNSVVSSMTSTPKNEIHLGEFSAKTDFDNSAKVMVRKHITPLAGKKTPNFSKKTTLDLTKCKIAFDDDDIVESSLLTPNGDQFRAPMALSKWKQKIPKLKAGKSWRRSLLMHKRESVIDLTSDVEDVSFSLVGRNLLAKRQSIKIVPLCDHRLSRRVTVLQTYAHSNLSTKLDDSVTDVTNINGRSSNLSLEKPLPLITAKDIVLKRCGQTEPQPFNRFYHKSLLKDCKKIGEGVYGEVFLYTNPSGGTTVMKVIPIEGNKMINQERQKKFDEILSEIIIALELSKLRKSTYNQTSAFSEVQRICCVKGKYPKILLDLWDEYNASKGSENDHPEIFENDQLYIVLDLANGGRDLEAFVFNNALQAMSMFKQVACALAVAEQQLQFEHRDLHWGNVLLKSVDRNKMISCKHKGKVIESHTQGVEVTIIDFTLSRIVHDGVVIFNDLGQDPDLFVAEGDYQFEIYRLMKKENSNNWQTFQPYSNILWLHYIIDKSITALRYKNIKTKVHKKNVDCLKEYERVILKFKSVSEFVSQYY